MEHNTFFQSISPSPRKQFFFIFWGEEGGRGTWDMVENGSYISSILIINFAFKLGKSPLAAKRE